MSQHYVRFIPADATNMMMKNVCQYITVSAIEEVWREQMKMCREWNGPNSDVRFTDWLFHLDWLNVILILFQLLSAYCRYYILHCAWKSEWACSHLQFNLQCEKYMLSILNGTVSRAQNWEQVGLSDTRQNECILCRNEWRLSTYEYDYCTVGIWNSIAAAVLNGCNDFISPTYHHSPSWALPNTINFVHFIRNSQIRLQISLCLSCFSYSRDLTHIKFILLWLHILWIVIIWMLHTFFEWRAYPDPQIFLTNGKAILCCFWILVVIVETVQHNFAIRAVKSPMLHFHAALMHVVLHYVYVEVSSYVIRLRVRTCWLASGDDNKSLLLCGICSECCAPECSLNGGPISGKCNFEFSSMRVC